MVCGFLKLNGMLKCCELLIMMFVFYLLGVVIRVRVSRLVVIVIRLLWVCMVLVSVLWLLIWLKVFGYCSSML